MDFIKVGDVHTEGTLSGVCTPSDVNDIHSCLKCAFFPIQCSHIACEPEQREDHLIVNFLLTSNSKTI